MKSTDCSLWTNTYICRAGMYLLYLQMCSGNHIESLPLLAYKCLQWGWSFLLSHICIKCLLCPTHILTSQSNHLFNFWWMFIFHMMLTFQFKPVPTVYFLVAPKSSLFNACTSKVISVIICLLLTPGPQM